jgi:hypothetical protein
MVEDESPHLGHLEEIKSQELFDRIVRKLDDFERSSSSTNVIKEVHEERTASSGL